MLEIPPVTTLYPLTKPVTINKDDPRSKREQPRKQPVPTDQTPQPAIEHIDEIA